MPFTLQPKRWYGWQMIPGYVSQGCVPFFCPCRINEVKPHKSGKGLLTLDVWVTGYAEGVNNGDAPLRVIHRGDTYLIAQILYPDAPEINRCVVICEIAFEWVQRFCPQLWQENPPERLRGGAGSITSYLEAVFRPENDWRPDLIDDVVIHGILRFDGSRRDAELNRETPGEGTYQNFMRLHEQHFSEKPWRLHPDPLVNWGELFWLQRSHKWGGLDREGALLMAWLFIRLHDQPMPQGYEYTEHAEMYARLKHRATQLANEWAAHV